MLYGFPGIKQHGGLKKEEMCKGAVHDSINALQKSFYAKPCNYKAFVSQDDLGQVFAI